MLSRGFQVRAFHQCNKQNNCGYWSGSHLTLRQAQIQPVSRAHASHTAVIFTAPHFHSGASRVLHHLGKDTTKVVVLLSGWRGPDWPSTSPKRWLHTHHSAGWAKPGQTGLQPRRESNVLPRNYSKLQASHQREPGSEPILCSSLPTLIIRTHLKPCSCDPNSIISQAPGTISSRQLSRALSEQPPSDDLRSWRWAVLTHQPQNDLARLRVEKRGELQPDPGRGAAWGYKPPLGEQLLFEITRRHIIKKVISPRMGHGGVPQSPLQLSASLSLSTLQEQKKIKMSQEIKLQTWDRNDEPGARCWLPALYLCPSYWYSAQEAMDISEFRSLRA